MTMADMMKEKVSEEEIMKATAGLSVMKDENGYCLVCKYCGKRFKTSESEEAAAHELSHTTK